MYAFFTWYWDSVRYILIDDCAHNAFGENINTSLTAFLGFPFVGLLFTGFMLTEDGPKVLEYNVRFGDPETEALMMLLDPKIDLASVFLVCPSRLLSYSSSYLHPTGCC